MALKLALWSTLFIEAADAFEPPLSLICQAVCLLVIMLFQGRISAWGQPVGGPQVVNLVAATLFLAVFALVLHVFVSFQRPLRRQGAAIGAAG